MKRIIALATALSLFSAGLYMPDSFIKTMTSINTNAETKESYFGFH